MGVKRFLCLSFLCPFLAYAKPLRMVTFAIPLMVENSQRGLFVDLTRDIAQRGKIDLEIEIVPTGKALLHFTNGKFEGLFPALDVYTPKNAVKTLPFYEKIDFVFYRKNKPLKTFKDLEGKKVGLTFRYPYVAQLTANKKIHFEYAADDVTNMKKLSKGSIDAFVVEERSGLQALEQSHVEGVTYDSTQPLSRQDVYYAFRDDEEGRKMAKAFSEAIASMKSDGSLKKRLITHQPKPLE
ncbi:MAG: transporter substrate-binding domain-containing protein [Bdellovibrio sp.]|nr:transporter substrate-binding domain-containing protein [Bdellovibrio sp.]